MDLKQFFKDQYFYELKRREELTNNLTIPIGILTGLSGVIGVYLFKFKFQNLSFETGAFLFLVSLSLIAIIVTGYYLIRSYWRLEYGYLADSLEIKEYYDGLLQFYIKEGNDSENASRKAIKEFKNYIIERYATNADHNAKRNDLKSKYIHNANLALIFSLTFVFFSAFPFFWNFF